MKFIHIMEKSTDMNEFRKVLQGSKNIIAIAGAGLSAASGHFSSYPDLHIKIDSSNHRDSYFQRKWGDLEEVQRHKTCNPRRVQEISFVGVAILPLPSRSVSQSIISVSIPPPIFFAYRVLKAKPNDAHRALAAFSQDDIRNQIAPRSKFTLITQNIDGLSPKANEELAKILTQYVEADVIEMHGRLFDILCTNPMCNHTEFNTTSPICEALAGTENLSGKGIIDPDIDLKDLPRCSKCTELARPGVVWFDEIPHRLDEIDELVEDADLCLVIGTSSVVG